MLAKLAFRNIKRQLGNYLIYFITVSLTVGLMFAVNSLIFEQELLARTEIIENLDTALMLITLFISVIVAFVLGYATSFMLKLRKREFGTYLTLGMTRRNILCIFLFESLILCGVSLITGLLLGLGFYQGIMAIVTSVMDAEFAFAAYSYQGFLLTAGLVVAIFALSSAASAIYLRTTSIYNLIHGAKKTEKSVKLLPVWCVLTVVALVGIIVSIFFVDSSVKIILSMTDKNDILKTVLSMAALAGSIILFHVSLSKSLIGLLMRTKKFKHQGTSIFTLRQLSSKLSANSILIGLLAFLISFAVIGANSSFAQRIRTNAVLDRDFPFDVSSMVINKDKMNITFDEAQTIVEKYSPIKNRVEYSIYSMGDRYIHGFTDRTGPEYWAYYDTYIEVSDFNRVYGEIGYRPVSLGDNGFMLSAYDHDVEQFDFSEAQLQLADMTLEYKGYAFCPLIGNGVYDFIIVVPDGATQDMTRYYDGVIFTLEQPKYDATSLREELMATEHFSETTTYVYTDYNLREYARIMENASNAVYIVGALYIAIVFVFLAMAILALKTLSGVSDDKQRYMTLSRIGTSKRDMRRTLFRQIFTFFALPFLLPILLSIPAGVICTSLMALAGVPEAIVPTIAATACIAAVMLVVYALYFVATYLLSKRTVIPA